MSVSASTFGRLCSVSRQAIFEAGKAGRIIKAGKLISLENPKNRAFLIEHGGKIDDYLSLPVNPEKNLIDEAESRQTKELKLKLKEAGLSEDILTDEIRKLLMIERRKKLQIENEVTMGHLISRKLTISMLNVIGQEIQTSFINMPRRCSHHLAALAKNPKLEIDFEEYLAEYISKGISNVKSKIQGMCENGFFEDIFDEV